MNHPLSFSCKGKYNTWHILTTSSSINSGSSQGKLRFCTNRTHVLQIQLHFSWCSYPQHRHYLRLQPCMLLCYKQYRQLAPIFIYDSTSKPLYMHILCLDYLSSVLLVHKDQNQAKASSANQSTYPRFLTKCKWSALHVVAAVGVLAETINQKKKKKQHNVIYSTSVCWTGDRGE